MAEGSDVCGCCQRRPRWAFYDKVYAYIISHDEVYPKRSAHIKEQLFEHVPQGASLLEVGVGTGPNLRYYTGRDLTITGLDPNDACFSYARENAAKADIPEDRLTLTAADAEAMPFADDSFDVAVSTLVLCSVASQERVLGEILRVLKPGGKFLFLEHVEAFEAGRRQSMQRLLDPLQYAWAGCHFVRRTGDAIQKAGFADVQLQRWHLEGSGIIWLISPHVWGCATAAGGGTA